MAGAMIYLPGGTRVDSEASTPKCVYTFCKKLWGYDAKQHKNQRHLGSANMLRIFVWQPCTTSMPETLKKCPLSVFTFYPPIDRSRCLANTLRQIYEKGSFEQF